MKVFENSALNMIQKYSLQLALTIMSVTALSFALMNMINSQKDPLVIERGCDSKIINLQSISQTKDEIESFIKTALSARFDSNLKNDPSIFLTELLQIARSKEQTELKNKGIDQRVFVRSIKFDQDKYLVEADRLIGVGKIRSAVPLDLVISISSKLRSLSNPYGLVLTTVDQLKSDVPNDK